MRIIILNDNTNVGAQYIEPLQNAKPIKNICPSQNSCQHIIPKSIGSIIRCYKGAVTRWCNSRGYVHFCWQRNYHEHIIRNHKELMAIRQYIINNPRNWRFDEDNPLSGCSRRLINLTSILFH